MNFCALIWEAGGLRLFLPVSWTAMKHGWIAPQCQPNIAYSAFRQGLSVRGLAWAVARGAISVGPTTPCDGNDEFDFARINPLYGRECRSVTM
jgi:hypothetical protein